MLLAMLLVLALVLQMPAVLLLEDAPVRRWLRKYARSGIPGAVPDNSKSSSGKHRAGAIISEPSSSA